MATFGYLRVSTSKQDVEAQRLGVLDYANTRKMGRVALVEDSASGRVPWRERGIGKVLEQAKKGDAIVVTSFRSTSEWKSLPPRYCNRPSITRSSLDATLLQLA